MSYVVIGGFAGSGRQVRRAADGVAEYYQVDKSDVESISFAQAMGNPEGVSHRALYATVLTHSAGMLAVKSARPEHLLAVAPPFPRSVPSLIGRAGLKTVRMTYNALSDSARLRDVLKMNREQAGELLCHPFGNIGRIGEIATCDALGVKAAMISTNVEIVCMEQDAFRFQPPDHLRKEVYWLPGGHDDFMLDPVSALEKLREMSEE